MARPKKVTEQPTGNTDNPIIEDVVNLQPTEEEFAKAKEALANRPASQATYTTKPVFAEIEDPYRALLLERPNVPVITNLKEAIDFVEVYQRWNRKVQLQFK